MTTVVVWLPLLPEAANGTVMAMRPVSFLFLIDVQNGASPTAALLSGQMQVRVAAEQNGGVDGGMLSWPTSIRARTLGMRELVNVAKLDDPFPPAWAASSRSYLAEHRDAIRRYVQSIAQAIAFEIRNPEETQSILAKYVSIDNPAVAKEAYDDVVPYLKENPIPETKAIKSALDELSATYPNSSTADPATFVDQTFAQELQASGFIDGLYK